MNQDIINKIKWQINVENYKMKIGSSFFLALSFEKLYGKGFYTEYNLIYIIFYQSKQVILWKPLLAANVVRNQHT